MVMVDDELKKIQDEQKAFDEGKARDMMIARVADNLGNRQSFGNFYSGKMAEHNDILKNEQDRLAATPSPLERQSKLLSAYRAKKDQERQLAASDPTSEFSQQQQKLMGGLSPKLAKQFAGMSAEQIEENFKNPLVKEYLSRESDMAKLAMQERLADKKRNPAKEDFERLPMEAQEQVKKLSGRSGDVKGVKNLMDSTLSIFDDPGVSEDQKIVKGRELLKVLNSPLGADAVGAEEAKRLGGFLEYKIGNFTQPGSFWGRDMDKFTEQVRLKSGELADSLSRNEAEVNRLYGRPGGYDPNAATDARRVAISKGGAGGSGLIPEAHAGPRQPTFTAQDLQALQWLKANPKDPDAANVRARLARKGLQ